MFVRRLDYRLGFVSFLGIKDLLCDIFKVFVTAGLQGPVKAGLVSDVTLAGVDGHFEDDTVLVTIHEYFFYFLNVAAFLAFLPQFFP
jgi:hypothetical protein